MGGGIHKKGCKCWRSCRKECLGSAACCQAAQGVSAELRSPGRCPHGARQGDFRWSHKSRLWSPLRPGWLAPSHPPQQQDVGWRCRERSPSALGKVEALTIHYYDFLHFPLYGRSWVRSLQTLVVWLPSVNQTLNRRKSLKKLLPQNLFSTLFCISDKIHCQ